jgi:hypothetical protein
LPAIEIGAHGNAIVILRGMRQAFGRGDKLVKASRFFFMRSASQDGDAVNYYRRPTDRNRVSERQTFLLLIQAYIGHVPKTD